MYPWKVIVIATVTILGVICHRMALENDIEHKKAKEKRTTEH
jgi:hypothetical protein